MPRGFQLGCMRIIAEISLFNHWYKIVNLKAVGPIRPPLLVCIVQSLMDNRLQCSIELLSRSRCLFALQTSDRYPFIDNLCHARITRWGKELCSKALCGFGKGNSFLEYIFLEYLVTFMMLCRKWKETINMHLKFMIVSDFRLLVVLKIVCQRRIE